jgi:hypothetical protein
MRPPRGGSAPVCLWPLAAFARFEALVIDVGMTSVA